MKNFRTLLALPAAVVFAGCGGGGENVIPGTPTDAYLLANYPAASYSGYTAFTSDLGTERSDGKRWLILNPPVPAGAAAAGFHTLIYALHPIVSDVNLTQPNTTSYFTYGLPGGNYGNDSSYYTTADGQLTLENPGNGSFVSGNIMAAQTYQNDNTYADTAGPLAPLSASDGYYIESATTTTVNDGNNWPSFWIWTYEGMTSNETSSWIELDINEWGFNQAGPPYGGSCGSSCGTLTSLIYWTGNGVRSGLAQLFSPKNLDMTSELVMGAAWDAGHSQVEVWENGSELGTIAFSSTTPTAIPTSAWSGYHHFPLFGANSHNYTATPAFNFNVRYVMAWGPP